MCVDVNLLTSSFNFSRFLYLARAAGFEKTNVKTKLVRDYFGSGHTSEALTIRAQLLADRKARGMA